MASKLGAFVLALLLLPPACARAASAASGLPHLETRGHATQLIVDGKPFLILGGELHNSSSSSVAYMKPIWPRLAALHLNTVALPVAGETIEPE
ncbi:MAG: glycoside hydrolase family 42, partial [Acidobacteriota bacterium]